MKQDHVDRLREYNLVSPRAQAATDRASAALHRAENSFPKVLKRSSIP